MLCLNIKYIVARANGPSSLGSQEDTKVVFQFTKSLLNYDLSQRLYVVEILVLLGVNQRVRQEDSDIPASPISIAPQGIIGLATPKRLCPTCDLLKMRVLCMELGPPPLTYRR